MPSFSTVVGNLLLPPALFALVLIFALMIMPARRGLAWILTALCAAGLLALSTPLVSDRLASTLENGIEPLTSDTQSLGAQAIVVLAGGWTMAGEYGGDTVNALSLERLRYAAKLHRETGLPLMLVGGARSDAGNSEAELMSRALREDYGLSAGWLEEDSRNTAENARYAAALARKEGVEKVLLVTHAYHMPRALEQFRRAGLETVAASTRAFGGSREPAPAQARDLLPSASAFFRSYLSLHEMLGMLWYRLRY